MDRGHERTEQVINKIEGRLRAEYEQAAKEVEETLKDYMERFDLKDKKWQEWVKDGKRTQGQYDAWRKQQLMQGERWKQLKNQLANDMVNTTSAARDIVQSYMPEVYEINANYALYQVEVGGGYTLPSSLTLYNREAIARLVKDEPDLMPMGKSVLGDIARGKAQRWERQKVQSIMMQGILQGKSNVRIAQDIAENLANGDFKASMRYARTMSTNAQNGGRYGAYRRLEANGVPLTLQWEATLDMRTRHEHRMMHGQRRNVNQPFEVDGVEILYPAWLGMGDYKVPPDLVWNCRCTILAWVKGFEHDALKTSERMEGLSYEDWLNAKERPDPITKQRDIGETMRMRYIREYGGDGSGLRKEEPKVEYKQLASGDEANKYFGQRPERSLRRSDREEYDRQRELYEKSMYGRWYNNLTGEQVSAIGAYTGDTYAGINGLLRGQMTERMVDQWNATENMTVQRMIEEITTAIKEFELDEPINVLRYCDPDVLRSLPTEAGAIFHDDGFGSTCAIDKKVASGNVRMNIHVPAGKGYGAYVNPLSGAEDDEYEFLLQRGTDYRVVSIAEQDGETVVDLEVVGQTDNGYKYATKEQVIQRWKEMGIYEELKSRENDI